MMPGKTRATRNWFSLACVWAFASRDCVYLCRQLTQEYVPDAQSLQPYGLQVLLLASHFNVASCVQLIKDTFLHVPILYLITTYSKITILYVLRILC
jgi:hypothetical protein